jgi:Leucine-rich repeat (LRR) protein
MITPEKMRHLRYLEFSYYDIKALPETISTLYLLHTLKLSHCMKLEKLPEGMRYMSSLQHLYIERCYNLRCMPESLGELNSLQILTTYIVGIDDHNSIRELNKLNNLHGQLHLYNLRNIKHVADAMEANLMAKQNLDELALCWAEPNYYRGFTCYDVPASSFQEVMHCDPFEILNALKPSNKLKVLEVTLYRGDRFPVWMTEYQMLENLIELYIIECRECTEVPPVEMLPFLRILKLKHLDNLRHLCNNASTRAQGSEHAPVSFPSLKSMVLYEMPNLCSWYEGEDGNKSSLIFPELETLEVINCPMLTAMPIVPSLVSMSVKGNNNLSCFATGLTTLHQLSLKGHGGNDSISFQPWESLSFLFLEKYNSVVPVGANEGEVSITPSKCQTLKFVEVQNIPLNMTLWFWKCFEFLEVLSIRSCVTLVYWPEEGFTKLSCLKELDVGQCPNFLGSQLESQVRRSITEVLLPKLENITILWCPNLIEVPKCSTSIRSMYISGCQKLQCLPEWMGSMITLKNLTIDYCDSLNSLPSNIGGLTSLEELNIRHCPNLAHLPEGMHGIKALKKLEIKSCPNMRVLPEGLLEHLKNLDELWIEACPNLEKHFRKHGKYRHLISDTRVTKIGDENTPGRY